MSGQRPQVVYLLRLWQAYEGDGPVWRAWLSCPNTGERCGFGTLQELFDYLQARVLLLGCEMGTEPEQGDDPEPSEELG